MAWGSGRHPLTLSQPCLRRDRPKLYVGPHCGQWQMQREPGVGDTWGGELRGNFGSLGRE